MFSLLKNIYYYFYNNITYTHTNIIDNGEYERDLTIRTVKYDIQTWHNKQMKKYNPECVIKSDIYNNTKPVWLISYYFFSRGSSKIYIYNVPVEKKKEMLYNTINEKINDHLLHGDGASYVYATYILVSDTIPDLSFLNSIPIILWITSCDYIIRPNIKGNGIYCSVCCYDINMPFCIDLTKSNIYRLSVDDGNYIILPPFNTYIEDNFNLSKIRI